MTTAITTSSTLWLDPTDYSVDLYDRGPITTLFQPPVSCSATLTHMSDAVYDNFYMGYLDYAFSYYTDKFVDLACYPSGTQVSDALVESSSWSLYYYSPALCPYGWSTATVFGSTPPASLTTVVTESTYDGSVDATTMDQTEFWSLNSGTTAALCCPSGYNWESDFGIYDCTSQMTAGQIVAFINPTDKGTSWDIGNVTTTTLSTRTIVACNGIPVWQQSSDSAVLESAAKMTPTLSATNSIATATPRTSMASSIPAPTTTNTMAASSHSGGLSTGAKIGIGVGVPLGLVALLLMGLSFLLFRRLRASRMDRSNLPELQAQKKGPPRYPTHNSMYGGPMQPAYHSPQPEISQSAPAEAYNSPHYSPQP